MWKSPSQLRREFFFESVSEEILEISLRLTKNEVIHFFLNAVYVDESVSLLLCRYVHTYKVVDFEAQA